MRAPITVLIGVALALSTTALAWGASTRERAIGAENDSGQYGTVSLTPRGSETLVRVRLFGAPTSHAEPAHIHLGECPRINPVPAYPLNSVVDGRSTTLVKAPISKLMSGHYSVNVHKSASDLKHYVACGYLAPGA